MCGDNIMRDPYVSNTDYSMTPAAKGNCWLKYVIPASFCMGSDQKRSRAWTMLHIM